MRVQIRIACALVVLLASCGDSGTQDTGGSGGDGATGGSGGDTAGVGGGGGEMGVGGMGGAGGGGGAPRTITSSLEWKASELVYQDARCACQPGEPIAQSACLAVEASLPFSDRQNACFDDIVLNEELMTLETRLECLVAANLAGVDCLRDVDACDAEAVATCETTTAQTKQDCPVPFADVIPLTAECSATVAADGVDAFLDAREARCDCLPNCMNAERDPSVSACMEDTLAMELAMLGPDGPDELACFTEFWRKNAVCFGNESSCDGAITACSDIPPVFCAIDATLLEACLAP